MLYVSFPTLTESERLARLQPIDWAQVRLTPADAIAASGLSEPPRTISLEMLGDAPVYRMLGWDSIPRTISALTSEPLRPVDAPAAMELIQLGPGAVSPRLVATVQRDQWTVAERYRMDRPLHRVALGDAAGTELYVSSQTGAVVLDTTAQERFWNWLGAVPHWLYLTPLRSHQPAWRQVVIWTSAACIGVAVSGTVLGVLRLRLRRRGKGARWSPYRGWARWHHLSGLLGGIFLLGWIVSGWLSVDPGRLFAGTPLPRSAVERYRDLTVADYAIDLPRLGSSGAVAVQFSGVGGRLVATLLEQDGRRTILNPHGEVWHANAADIARAAARLLPGSVITKQIMLNQEDEDWYSHRGDQRSLPVLKLEFGDPANSWVYIDPTTGVLLRSSGARQRLYRWLYAAPHRFDFSPIRNRPLWDVVMIGLLLTGLVAAVSSIRLGWRRLRQ